MISIQEISSNFLNLPHLARKIWEQIASATDSIVSVFFEKRAQAVQDGIPLLFTLHTATTTGKVEHINTLATQETINEEDAFGRTPLYLAVMRGDHKAASLLLQKGASMKKATKLPKHNPIKEAIRSKNPYLLELLLEQIADEDKLDLFVDAHRYDPDEEIEPVQQEMLASLK